MRLDGEMNAGGTGAYLRFRYESVGGPTAIPEDSNRVVYATGAAEVVIPVVAVIARVAAAVRVDHDFLADFQAFHCRSNGVDRARKFMAKRQKTFRLAWERSLNNRNLCN